MIWVCMDFCLSLHALSYDLYEFSSILWSIILLWAYMWILDEFEIVWMNLKVWPGAYRNWAELCPGRAFNFRRPAKPMEVSVRTVISIGSWSRRKLVDNFRRPEKLMEVTVGPVISVGVRSWRKLVANFRRPGEPTEVTGWTLTSVGSLQPTEIRLPSVGGRRKLRNFHRLISIGYVPTEISLYRRK
jgi:hypothetical protein